MARLLLTTTAGRCRWQNSLCSQKGTQEKTTMQLGAGSLVAIPGIRLKPLCSVSYLGWKSWNSDTACSAQCRVWNVFLERLATKGYDDMKHWTETKGKYIAFFNLRLGPATKGWDDLQSPGSCRASSYKRLWRHEAVKLKASCNDKTVHNKSCCAGWTHVGRDNNTYSNMYTSMDIWIHILTYVYLYICICL